MVNKSISTFIFCLVCYFLARNPAYEFKHVGQKCSQFLKILETANSTVFSFKAKLLPHNKVFYLFLTLDQMSYFKTAGPNSKHLQMTKYIHVPIKNKFFWGWVEMIMGK